MGAGSAGDGTAAQQLLERRDEVDKSLHFIAIAMIKVLHTLVENSQQYTLKKNEMRDWLEVTNCQLETGRLLLVFSKERLRVMEALIVTCPLAPTTKVVQVDENSNSVT